MDQGHRGLPHTADLRIEAWAPTRERCLAEAVAALRDGVADTTGVSAQRIVETDLTAGTDEDALLAALDEVIYLLDAEGVFPIRAEVRPMSGGQRLRLGVVPASDIDLSVVPKAVALSGLAFEFAEGCWRCTATIDV